MADPLSYNQLLEKGKEIEEERQKEAQKEGIQHIKQQQFDALFFFIQSQKEKEEEDKR